MGLKLLNQIWSYQLRVGRKPNSWTPLLTWFFSKSRKKQHEKKCSFAWLSRLDKNNFKRELLQIIFFFFKSRSGRLEREGHFLYAAPPFWMNSWIPAKFYVDVEPSSRTINSLKIAPKIQSLLRKTKNNVEHATKRSNLFLSQKISIVQRLHSHCRFFFFLINP